MSYCLVTGGAGFIGSHLVEALLARGDRVAVIDDESTGRRENLAAVLDHPRLHYTRGDVQDRALLAGRLAGVDEVYHLAAAVGVALVAHRPVHSIETNIRPTELLLEELLREQQIRDGRGRPPARLFLASTSEVYGKNPKLTWNEADDLVLGATSRPRWAYGASKAIGEFTALAYHREHGLPVVVGRLFNVIGPRQTGTYGMVVPRMVEAALRGEPVIVHGDGRQQRTFAHVAEVVEATLRLMRCDAAAGQVVNIGSDRPLTILDLARRVIDQIDPAVPIEFQSYAEAYGPDFEDCRCRLPELNRLRGLIGFAPTRPLEEIIAEVVAERRG
ncbi:MAG: NAD-dependent epimerase/dehydratase family protein [Pirellulales bacterium]